MHLNGLVQRKGSCSEPSGQHNASWLKMLREIATRLALKGDANPNFLSAPRVAESGDGLLTTISHPYVPASKTRSADVVIYLDLDGVVHHESVLFHPKCGVYMSPSIAKARVLFEWASILIDILTPYPNVRLVLSSSWCVRPGYAETLKRLPEALRWRFIGGTFHKRVQGADPWMKETFLRTPRGVQVLEDVKRRKPRHWIALDDDVEGWPVEGLDNLVACDGRTGLSAASVQQTLISRLRSFKNESPES